MKKTVFGLLFAAVAAMILMISPVTAKATPLGAAPVRSTPGTETAVVTGDALSAAEREELTALASKLAEELETSIYIVAEDAGAKDAEAAGLQFLKDRINAGGGYGDVHRAVILYVNTNANARSYAVLERADDGSQKLSSKAVNAMLADNSELRTKLRDAQYAEAAKVFLDEVESDQKPGFFRSIWMKLIAALGLGGAASGIAVGTHKAQNKTKKREYLKDGRINVLDRNDVLQGTQISRKNVSSSSSNEDHRVEKTTHGGSNTF